MEAETYDLISIILMSLPRLIGAALDVVMREWHTTPDRCAQLMKDRLSSIPVSTASETISPPSAPFQCLQNNEINDRLVLFHLVQSIKGPGACL